MTRLVSLADAAQELPLSEQTIRRAVAAKRFPHTRVGRRVLIDMDQVEDQLAQECRENRSDPMPKPGDTILREAKERRLRAV